MRENFSFQLGEFPFNLTFFDTNDELFDGINLAVFDQKTATLFADKGPPRLVWPSGELSKVWPSIDFLLKACLEAGLARDSVLAGVGGGVVTDMCAFGASLYMRGCGLVLIPTTLLAMVDAAIGGKTGIDFGGYKNLVGTFYPAQEVRIWTGVLSSLSEREYLSGLAEVIKHGMLGARRVWELVVEKKQAILDRDPVVLAELVREAALFKAGVVSRDLREQGERAYLNLGHTFGHALESVLGFDGSWTHGEAVAWGLDRALCLGVSAGVTDAAWRDQVRTTLTDYGYRLVAPGVDPAAVMAAMRHDKKKRSGVVRFVLQRRWGQTFLQTIPDDLILTTITEAV